MIPVPFIRSVFLYQIVIACRRDMRKSSPTNWTNLEELEEHQDRKQQISTRMHSPTACLTPVPERCSVLRRGFSIPHGSASGLDIWAEGSVLSPRHSPCWQRFASLWEQPQWSRPNAQSSPKSCCILVTPYHAGPLYAFWEGEAEPCAQFSKEGDAIVLESGRMTFCVRSPFWHCLIFWNTVHWNAALLETIYCNVDSFAAVP